MALFTRFAVASSLVLALCGCDSSSGEADAPAAPADDDNADDDSATENSDDDSATDDDTSSDDDDTSSDDSTTDDDAPADDDDAPAGDDDATVGPAADDDTGGELTDDDGSTNEPAPDLNDAGRVEPEPEAPPRDYPNGDPGCGLEAAAFCDTFDEVAAAGLPEGRSGDLDPQRYAGERAEVTNYGEEAWAVPYAATRPCREGLGERVGPDEDLLICDGTEQIQSRHAMIVTAEQNYGQAGVRIRQPFDFFEREGRIVFDLDGEPGGTLLGWNAISITEDPSPNPSFAILQNFENGPIPRRGIEIHFASNCRSEGFISVSQVHVFDEWVDNYIDTEDDGNPPCVTAAEGHLNHFEVRISRTHLEVLGTNHSNDGIAFGELVPLFESDLDLAFDRGYVHLTTHNHATLKYSDNTIDAWVSRWDNVGFDGPVIDDRREISIGNSFTTVSLTHDAGDGTFVDEERTNIGYQIGGSDEGPLQTFTFPNTDTAGATTAFVSLNAHLLMGWEGFDFRNYVLRYRINGGEWQDYALYPGVFSGPFVYDENGMNTREEAYGLGGRVAVRLEVPPEALMDGDNTFEIVTHDVPRSYPPIVANLDLVLLTE
jgi:hypothetical protein